MIKKSGQILIFHGIIKFIAKDIIMNYSRHNAQNAGYVHRSQSDKNGRLIIVDGIKGYF